VARHCRARPLTFGQEALLVKNLNFSIIAIEDQMDKNVHNFRHVWQHFQDTDKSIYM